MTAAKPKSEKKSKRLTISVEPSLADAVAALAVKDGRTLAGLVRARLVDLVKEQAA